MPDRSLVMKGGIYKRGKLSKQRFIVILCASMTGGKMKLTLKDKSIKLRTFKNVKPKDLPVFCRAYKSAWVTSALFKEWVRGIDAELRKKKWSILLIVDSCPSYPRVNNLINVKVKFLPPHTTSKTQSLDQGIIQTSKCTTEINFWNGWSRKHKPVGTSALALLTAASINVLNPVHWIHSAWNKVK